MPRSRPSWLQTGKAPTECLSISRAAQATLSSGATVTVARLINSETRIPFPPLFLGLFCPPAGSFMQKIGGSG
jgi:hypothetical protein